MPTHTHYDNLKVGRNAPPEVIRAAYRALAQKYHPDKNGGNEDAARIMGIINSSYEVLIDPEKRRQHDSWITAQECVSVAPPPQHRAAQSAAPAMASQGTSASPQRHPAVRVIAHVFNYWIIYTVLGTWFWYANIRDATPNSVSERRHASARVAKPLAPPKPTWQRPVAAPNGQTWPGAAGYLYGVPVGARGGLSKLTIDNSQNDSDVHVKLYSLMTFPPNSVRQIFIPQGAKFTLQGVIAGVYDVRYLNLNSGSKSRSEQVTLDETITEVGTTFSNVTMTLYKVRNGNMQTYSIGDHEF